MSTGPAVVLLHGYGETGDLWAPLAAKLRGMAENVEQGIVPGSGHWVMEENPGATVALVSRFLEQ